MIKTLKIISEKLNVVISVLASFGVLAVLVCCFLQVVCRYVFNSSLPWSEEAARYLFVWTSMLGFSIAVKNKSNASIDVISGRLKGRAKTVHTILCDLMIIGCCLVLCWFGCSILPTMNRVKSAAMLIPNGYLYACVPVACAVIIFHCFVDLILAASNQEEGRDSE